MRAGSKTTLLTAVLAAVVLAAAAKPTEKSSRLAKYTTLCKTKDPEINQCITKAMKDILKLSNTGIPELGIPTFEPFIIPEIDLTVFRSLSVSLLGQNSNSDKQKAFARNLVIHHSSDFELHNLKANMDKREFYLNLTFPILQIEGEYDVNIRMFNMPIKTTGPVYINATEIRVEATLYGKIVIIKEKQYLQFDNIDIKVNFKDYSLVINNLFKKDHNLNRALNDMIKSQKTELKTMALPMIEEMAGKMVLTLTNQILAGMSLDEIFILE